MTSSNDHYRRLLHFNLALISLWNFFPKTVLKFVTSRIIIWSRKSKFKTCQVIFKTIEEKVGKNYKSRLMCQCLFSCQMCQFRFSECFLYVSKELVKQEECLIENMRKQNYLRDWPDLFVTRTTNLTSSIPLCYLSFLRSKTLGLSKVSIISIASSMYTYMKSLSEKDWKEE